MNILFLLFLQPAKWYCGA